MKTVLRAIDGLFCLLWIAFTLLNCANGDLMWGGLTAVFATIAFRDWIQVDEQL